MEEKAQPLIKFTIPGEPIATARAGRRFNPKTGKAHSFTPEKTRNFKIMVKTAFQLAYPNFTPLTCPLEIRLSIFMPARLSMTKGEKAVVEADEKALPHSKKPDGKNIRWGLEDALEGLAFVNDSQVSRYRDEKTYSFRPRTEVEIYEIPVPQTRRTKIVLPKTKEPQ